MLAQMSVTVQFHKRRYQESRQLKHVCSRSTPVQDRHVLNTGIIFANR